MVFIYNTKYLHTMSTIQILRDSVIVQCKDIMHETLPYGNLVIRVVKHNTNDLH